MSDNTDLQPGDESDPPIVASKAKYESLDDALKLIQELLSNTNSDGGLVPAYIWDQNPLETDEGLDVVLLVHPHWSPRMLADHLRKKLDRIVHDPSDDTSFASILWKSESDG